MLKSRRSALVAVPSAISAFDSGSVLEREFVVASTVTGGSVECAKAVATKASAAVSAVWITCRDALIVVVSLVRAEACESAIC